MGLSRYLRRKWWDQERARELESYLELEIADNLARGMTPEEARSQARRKLGNITSVRGEIYRMNSLGWVETLWRNLHFAWRSLRKQPGFSLAVVAVLALGIGANTAIFTIVNAVLLRPLPFEKSDRLVRLFHYPPQKTFPGVRLFSVSPANFLDWQS
jgi:hypothetical protein